MNLSGNFRSRRRIISDSRERDVAQSEIESAIRLFFQFEDFVSAHLLACAAIEVLHQISASAAEATSKRALDKTLEQILGAEGAAQTREFIDLPYNFFKHSSSNPNTKIYVRPELTEVFIYSAAVDFRIMFDEFTPLMAGYASWFMARHPENFLVLPTKALKLINDLALEGTPLKQAIADGRQFLSKLF